MTLFFKKYVNLIKFIVAVGLSGVFIGIGLIFYDFLVINIEDFFVLKDYCWRYMTEEERTLAKKEITYKKQKLDADRSKFTFVENCVKHFWWGVLYILAGIRILIIIYLIYLSIKMGYYLVDKYREDIDFTQEMWKERWLRWKSYWKKIEPYIAPLRHKIRIKISNSRFKKYF